MRSLKPFLIISAVLVFVFLFSRNGTTAVVNTKDLDENMIDMMMYHDNLGLYLRKKDMDNAQWLLQGMDSTLQVIAGKFDEHRKLNDPFKKYYKKLLQPPIKNIRTALQQKNFPAAVKSYRLLTKNCNGCHIDHDIDKEVMDWSNPAIH